MIMLSRLNGLPFALNPDLIERAETTPDTVLTLCDGTKVLIGESVVELVELVLAYRARVLSLADRIEVVETPAPLLHVVPPTGREA